MLHYNDMKVRTISIWNFRSIEKMENIVLSNFTVFIGENNVGKSNILDALYIIYDKIKSRSHTTKIIHAKTRRYYNRFYMDTQKRLFYDWERDHQLNNETIENNETKFQIQFELTLFEKSNLEKIIINRFRSIPSEIYIMADPDNSKYRNKYRIKYNKTISNNKFILKGNLGLQLIFTKSQNTILMFDTNNPDMKYKTWPELLSFIVKHIGFLYIPTIRSSEYLKTVMSNLILVKLSSLERDMKYKKHFQYIKKIQKKTLDDLSKNLTRSISNFLPDVKNIDLSYPIDLTEYNSNIRDIIIDDGIPTSLEMKGLGTQNIIIISIMQHIAEEQTSTKNLVLLVEEPESHLHYDALRKLNIVLRKIPSQNNQVITSTHSPVFIDRSDLKNNILVKKNSVTHFNDLFSIRNALGIKTKNELEKTRIAIIVEGKNDSKILETCIKEKSTILSKLISDQQLRIIPIHGINNLSAHCVALDTYMIETFLFLDNDPDTISECDNIKKLDIIDNNHIVIGQKPKQSKSEIEDFVKPKYYLYDIEKSHDIKIKFNNKFKKMKWSDKMKSHFKDNHKLWNNDIKNNLKTIVSDSVAKHGYKTMIIQNNPILLLIGKLEKYEKQL